MTCEKVPVTELSRSGLHQFCALKSTGMMLEEEAIELALMGLVYLLLVTKLLQQLWCTSVLTGLC